MCPDTPDTKRSKRSIGLPCRCSTLPRRGLTSWTADSNRPGPKACVPLQFGRAVEKRIETERTRSGAPSTEQLERELRQLVGLREHGDARLGKHLVARHGRGFRRDVYVRNA